MLKMHLRLIIAATAGQQYSPVAGRVAGPNLVRRRQKKFAGERRARHGLSENLRPR